MNFILKWENCDDFLSNRNELVFFSCVIYIFLCKLDFFSLLKKDVRHKLENKNVPDQFTEVFDFFYRLGMGQVGIFFILCICPFFVSYVSKWMRKCVSVSKKDFFLLLTYRSSYGEAVQFDYFKLVFQWPRTFCESTTVKLWHIFFYYY